MSRCREWIVCLLVPVCAFGQTGLPVKRVVLYKNGVGYFEHLGGVRDNQDVSISFTSGQLNDVLKSLTVLDLNGGRIKNVGYGSAAPVSKQLGDLRLPVGEKSTLSEFLGALRGAKIEVRSGTNVIAGRLLSVERKTRISGGTTLEIDYLSLVTDAGELRTTELSPAFSVRLLEPGLPGKVDRYLNLVSADREPDTRQMVVSAEGTGDRSLFVSYISEVPVWKATYRIVLGSKQGQKPLLQGWAIVDNTVGQDWENVQLSLVAGAPQSFVQELSQPYYAKRPVVAFSEAVSTAPQTHESTLVSGPVTLMGTVTDPAGGVIAGAKVKAVNNNGMVLGETSTNADGVYRFGSLPEENFRLRVESMGFNRREITGINASLTRPGRLDTTLDVGQATESVEVRARVMPLQTSTSSMARIVGGRTLGSGSALGGSDRGSRRGNSPAGVPGGIPTDRLNTARAEAEAAALAQDLGDLFEYKLKEPITIAKNRSALVPIVNSPVQAEKVSLWNDRSGYRRPQRALWLTNTSGVTLDGGTFSVLEEETFAGEGLIDPIRPGEKRLISYATDLAVTASSSNATEKQRVMRCTVDHGVMTHESEQREKKTYTFRNEDDKPRTILVEHPVRTGYTLRSDVEPAESTASWKRFRVPVPPKQTVMFVIEESQPVKETFEVSNIDSARIALFVIQKSIDASVENALRRVLAQKDVVADFESKKEANEEESTKIYDDQQRLRENIKALKGSAEEKALLARYTKQLDEQESRLAALRKEGELLKKQIDDAEEILDKLIQELSFDVKL